MRFIRSTILLRLLFAVVTSILAITILGRNVQASNESAPLSHVGAVHNATDKKDVTAYGSWGYVNWTDPNLNGGDTSYHRVGVVQWSPWRFVEFGWAKTNVTSRCNGDTFCGIISYEDGTGAQNRAITGISRATHRYSMQYDPNNSKYWFYVDGVNVWNVNANFSSGNAVVAGGEVLTGVENMQHTRVYDLRYLACTGCGYTPWNGHVNYIDDPPYYNTNLDANSFYSDP